MNGFAKNTKTNRNIFAVTAALGISRIITTISRMAIIIITINIIAIITTINRIAVITTINRGQATHPVRLRGSRAPPAGPACDGTYIYIYIYIYTYIHIIYIYIYIS